MDKKTIEVVISGYGVAYPQSIKKDKHQVPNVLVDRLPRKVARTSCRSLAQAVSVSQYALNMAGYDIDQLPERLGLYVSQSGIQHSDYDDYQNAMDDLNQRDSLNFTSLWQSRKIHPLVAINGLSNNMLSQISVLWNIQGDCAAFVRDEHGAACALEEAFFSLSSGSVDCALVVVGGTSQDYIEGLIDLDFDDFSLESGAVALVLQTKDFANQSRSPVLASLDHLALSFNHEKTSYQNSIDQERWAGPILGLIEKLSENGLNQEPTTIPLQTQDAFGHACQFTIGIGH